MKYFGRVMIAIGCLLSVALVLTPSSAKAQTSRTDEAVRIWGVGTQMGSAEIWAFYDNRDGLIKALQNTIGAMQGSPCFDPRPWRSILNRVQAGASARSVLGEISSLINMPAAGVVPQLRNCTCYGTGGGPGGGGDEEPAVCDVSGSWRTRVSGIGESVWTLTPLGGGRYSAQEQGLGNARGAAVMSGNRLRLEWTFSQGNDTGYYEWTLDRECSYGDGNMNYTSGRSGTSGSHIERIRGAINPADYTRGNRLASAVILASRSTPTDVGIILEKGKTYFLSSEGVIGMWSDRRDGVDIYTSQQAKHRGFS